MNASPVTLATTVRKCVAVSVRPERIIASDVTELAVSAMKRDVKLVISSRTAQGRATATVDKISIMIDHARFLPGRVCMTVRLVGMETHATDNVLRIASMACVIGMGFASAAAKRAFMEGTAD